MKVALSEGPGPPNKKEEIFQNPGDSEQNHKFGSQVCLPGASRTNREGWHLCIWCCYAGNIMAFFEP